MRVFILVFFYCLSAATVALAQPSALSLFNDLEYLSSNEMEGRKSGTKGNKAARDYITGRFEEIGLKSFGQGYVSEFSITEPKQIEGNKGHNITGYLEGKSENVLVLTAHYDHLGTKGDEIYNGSDDNASGVAALLFLAENLKTRELKHTIIFSALDAEESGLLGAYAFVKDPPVKIDRIKLNVNFDMLSKNDKNELFVSGTYHYPNLKPFISRVSRSYPIDIKMGHDRPDQGHDDWTNSSDHAAFHKAGIPFLYFGVEDHPDYHKPSDTYERTNFDFFEKVAATLTDLVVRLDQQDLNKFAQKPKDR